MRHSRHILVLACRSSRITLSCATTSRHSLVPQSRAPRAHHPLSPSRTTPSPAAMHSAPSPPLPCARTMSSRVSTIHPVCHPVTHHLPRVPIGTFNSSKDIIILPLRT
eukprot:Phypoly_transcript_10731.p2 GENE.Phypoly_transcript_10731~~Phypoly_transcript_10731.p2  ORF type:complete len:108 (+),score=17.00 Phypoly_transcript_10731:882-1205(+)